LRWDKECLIAFTHTQECICADHKKSAQERGQLRRVCADLAPGIARRVAVYQALP
jgi:hypothetical protein